MPHKSLPRAAVAAIALLASSALLAQAPPVVVIDFGSRNVPLDPWSTVGAALLIALAAYAWARRRAAGFGRLSSWIAVVAAATGTAMLVSNVELIAKAEAISEPTVVTLTSSPATIAVPGGFGFFEVHNGTGNSVRIASVTLQNPLPGQFISEYRGVNCRAGLTLASGGICFILVDQQQQ